MHPIKVQKQPEARSGSAFPPPTFPPPSDSRLRLELLAWKASSPPPPATAVGAPRPSRGRHVTAEKSRGKVTASPAPGLARPGRADPVPPARPRETFRSDLARVASAVTLEAAGDKKRLGVGRPAWSTLGTAKSLVSPKTTHVRRAAPRPASARRLRKGLTAKPENN